MRIFGVATRPPHGRFVNSPQHETHDEMHGIHAFYGHLFIRADSSRVGKVFSCVCVSVFFSYDISKVDAARLPHLTQKCSKMNIEKSIYFAIKRLKIKVTSHNNSASVDFFASECWLLSVISGQSEDSPRLKL